ELALDALEHHGRGLLAGELGDLVELRREPRLAGLELLLARLQLGGALVQPLLGLVEPQGARVLLLAAAVEAVLLLVEPLALAPELLAHVAQLRPLALRLLAYALQLGPDALALARQVLLEALAQALLLFGPAAARLLELRLRRALGQLHRALGLALRLLDAGAVEPLGLGAGVGLLAPPQGQGGAGADGEAHQEEEDTDDGAHDGSPARPSSEAVDQATLAPPLPADIASITACLMASTRSGLVLRSSTAFSLPWPSLTSPKLNHEPDFCTTSRSDATCTRSPKRSMPRPKRMSTSASRKGGATLFFVTFTRTRLPTRSAPCFTSPLRLTSRRTLA